MKDSIVDILNNYNVILENIINSKTSLINIPIYVINLKKDIFRRSYIKYITKLLNLNIKLIIVDNISNDVAKSLNAKLRVGVVGCYLSHMWCLNDAIKNNFQHFLILEDDVVFKKDFIQILNSIEYTKYDMIQLGCCDFNLKYNLDSSEIDYKKEGVYYPKKIALGAYGNIYNINFARLLYNSKINSIVEFDTDFNEYYERYKIAVCYPNLITAELSTTNINHNFSIFSCRNSNYFINKCFLNNIDYSEYFFIWITFIEECFNIYKKTNKVFTNESYNDSIRMFSINYKNISDTIINVLENNGLYYMDINNIINNILEDKY
jgi:GR25 family glycosyltransferase involved in LPS biosynthesis